MPYWEVVIAVLVMIVSFLSYIVLLTTFYHSQDMRSGVLLPTEDTIAENMNNPLRYIDTMHTARYFPVFL